MSVGEGIHPRPGKQKTMNITTFNANFPKAREVHSWYDFHKCVEVTTFENRSGTVFHITDTGLWSEGTACVESDHTFLGALRLGGPRRSHHFALEAVRS